MFSLKKNGMCVSSLQLMSETAVVFPDTGVLEANSSATGSDDSFFRAKKALLH